MREVIFRGKQTDNGEWVEGNLIKAENFYFIIPLVSNGSFDKVKNVLKFLNPCYYINPETVGQFTGLVDKYGERKWEGDIFKFGDHLYIIEWDADELTFRAYEPFETDYSVDLAEFSANEIEVIGNIHDNPELLKGEVQE